MNIFFQGGIFKEMRKQSQIQTFFIACCFNHLTTARAVFLGGTAHARSNNTINTKQHPLSIRRYQWPQGSSKSTFFPSIYLLPSNSYHHSSIASMTEKQGFEEANFSCKNNTVQQTVAFDLVLPYTDGSHGSAKIVISDECNLYNSNDSHHILSISDFRDRLQVTINVLKQLHKTALWIEVSMNYARYIEACSGIEGMSIHHASGDKVHLSIWLKDDVTNKIPEYATHQIGVGAIVINSRNEILCVREKRRNFRKWKIPGGLAELGEDLEDAAIREVKEETGINCRFKNVLGFRHTHGMQFGRSDMYFVCMLEPEEGKVGIPRPVAQDGEIALAAWVPLQEYMDMVHGVDGESTGPHPMMQKMMELINVGGIQRTVVSSIVPGREPSPIYHAPTNSM